MSRQTRNYNEDTVVAQLNKKADLNVNQQTRTIQELEPPYSRRDVGIKSRGKIDFLCGYKDYSHFYVKKFY